MSSAPKRVLQLDVLRAVAILLVIGRHLEIPRPGGAMGVLAGLWFNVGWLGVDLFFVLSGFLIGGLLLGEHQKHGSLNVPRFLIRRGLKLYPPYFVFIAYLLLLPTAKALMAGGDVGGTFARQWGLYWPNLLFLQNYVGTNPAGHTWSLAVEEHFYLLLPLPLAALLAAGRARVFVPVCLVIVPAALLLLRLTSIWAGDPFAVKMSATHLRLDALLFGVGIRALAQYYPAVFAGLREWRRPFIAAGVILWLPNVFVDPGTVFIRTIGLTLTFIGAAAFLIAAYHTHASDFRRTGAVVRPLALVLGWVGVYSYGIYLWHVTAMGILERVAGRPVLAVTGSWNALAWSVTAVAVTAGAIGVGVVASRVVEWPVLRMRDRWFPSRTGTMLLAPSDAGPSEPPNLHPKEQSTPAAV